MDNLFSYIKETFEPIYSKKQIKFSKLKSSEKRLNLFKENYTISPELRKILKERNKKIISNY